MIDSVLTTVNSLTQFFVLIALVFVCIKRLTTWINHASATIHTITLGTLTLALAHPLRKSKLSASSTETAPQSSD